MRLYFPGPVEREKQTIDIEKLRERLGDGAEWVAEPTARGVLVRPADVPPRKLYCELTTDCNLDCHTCMRRSWDEPGGTMSPALFHRVLGGFRELPSAEAIQFGGFGEPLCHPDAVEFVAEASRAGLRTELLTNATLLTRPVAEGLLEGGLDVLIVSLDGASPATHEGIRRGSALAEVFDNVRRLNVLRSQREGRKPEIGVAFVAMRSNIAELPALRRQSLHLGFSFITVTNLVPHTREMADEILYARGTRSGRDWPRSSVVPSLALPRFDSEEEVLRALLSLQRTGTAIEFPGTELRRSVPDCRFVQEGRLAVRWDGALSPCLPLLHSHTHYVRGMAKRVRAYHVGSLATQSLGEVWRDPAYAAFRRRVRDFDFAPCVDCGSCELRETNEADCCGDTFPRCGECLWAAGFVQCP